MALPTVLEKSADLQGFRVSDRIRTGDRLDHNQELYQLSYAHRAPPNVAGLGAAAASGGEAFMS